MFHKSRSENGNNFMSPHNFDDPMAIATSPNLAVSATNNERFNINTQACAHQNMASSFNHSQSHISPNPNPSTSLGLSALDFDLSRDHHMNHQPYCSSGHDYSHNKMAEATKCEDDYGFLFDFDGLNAVPSGLEDMRFVDDSSSVFI